MARFDGKVAMLTGAGSGLGRECAKWWASEGATIVVTDINRERAEAVAKEIDADGGTAIALRADVAQEREVAAAVDTAVETYGRLNIMFANAGKNVRGMGAQLLDVSEDDWDDITDVVFKGAFFSGKHAARVMKDHGGAIVVTTSAAGINAYPGGYGHYAAGKAGAIGLVRAMALDFGRYGIRVNGLAPTHGMSPNFFLPPDAPVVGCSFEEAALRGIAGMREILGYPADSEWDPFVMFPGPLKLSRPPSLRDNAAVATFLASDDSMYMSGIVIPSCDGGSFCRTSIPIPDNVAVPPRNN